VAILWLKNVGNFDLRAGECCTLVPGINDGVERVEAAGHGDPILVAQQDIRAGGSGRVAWGGDGWIRVVGAVQNGVRLQTSTVGLAKPGTTNDFATALSSRTNSSPFVKVKLDDHARIITGATGPTGPAGPSLIPTSTASAPGIPTQAVSNSGLFATVAGYVGLAIGGALRWFANNVGLGIGVDPAQAVHTSGTGGSGLRADSYGSSSSTSDYALVDLRRARNTQVSPGGVLAADMLAAIRALGYRNGFLSAVEIIAEVDQVGNPAPSFADVVGGRLRIYVTDWTTGNQIGVVVVDKDGLTVTGTLVAPAISAGGIAATGSIIGGAAGTTGQYTVRRLGAGATDAASGNDSRLSDARTPTAHASTHNHGGGDVLAEDAVATTASLRSLGTGAAQAAAGNHTHALSYASTAEIADIAATEAAGSSGTVARGDHVHAVPSGLITTGMIADGTITDADFNSTALLVGKVHYVKVSGTGQSINTASSTPVALTNETADTNAYHDTVTNPSRMVAPVTGVYFCEGFLQWSAPAAFTGRILAAIVDNAGAVQGSLEHSVGPNGSTFPSHTVTATVPLTAGQWVELQAYHEAGSPRTINLARLSMRLVGY
jgi:hypothetical protein